MGFFIAINFELVWMSCTGVLLFTLHLVYIVHRKTGVLDYFEHETYWNQNLCSEFLVTGGILVAVNIFGDNILFLSLKVSGYSKNF